MSLCLLSKPKQKLIFFFIFRFLTSSLCRVKHALNIVRGKPRHDNKKNRIGWVITTFFFASKESCLLSLFHFERSEYYCEYILSVSISLVLGLYCTLLISLPLGVVFYLCSNIAILQALYKRPTNGSWVHPHPYLKIKSSLFNGLTPDSAKLLTLGLFSCAMRSF